MSDRLISYAQNGEDIVLWRAFREQDRGFYIDVGANHPVGDSVTKLFYDHRWSGINVEPLPGLFAELERERPRDVNLNVGVAASPGTMELHELPSTDGLSTFSPDLVERYRSESRPIRVHEVPVMTLTDICRQHVKGTIDFLKIDVEGFEQEVIAGADWVTYRPRVLVVERTFPERWEDMLEAAKYVHMQFDGINDFYVRNEDVDLLGPKIEQPATTVLDAYDPYHYVMQLEEATRSILDLRAKNARLQAELSEFTGRPPDPDVGVPTLRERLRQDAKDVWHALGRRLKR